MANSTSSKKQKAIQDNRDLLDLPLEIVHLILLKLPIDAIMDCIWVCRNWRNQILDQPNFSDRLLSRFSDNPMLFIINRSKNNYDYDSFTNYDHGDFCLLEWLDDTGINGQSLNLNMGEPFDIYQLYFAGSCNGLLCFSHENCNYVYIWNPIIKESVVLPKPTAMGEKKIYGFGFCPETNQYKVIQVTQGISTSDDPLVTWKFEIYSLGCDEEWRNIKYIPLFYHVMMELMEQDMMIPFEGYLHCFVKSTSYYGEKKIIIIAFNIGSEQLQLIELPSTINEQCRWIEQKRQSLCLRVLDNWLAVLHEVADGSCEIWVMKNYKFEQTWCKVGSIPLQIRGGFSIPNPLVVTKNKELWICEDTYRIVTFVPSFVSPKVLIKAMRS